MSSKKISKKIRLHQRINMYPNFHLIGGYEAYVR
jgi:hypothetical protein